MKEVRAVNPVAIVAFFVGYGIVITLWKTGIIPSPTIVTGALVFRLYLAGCAITGGKYQKPVGE